MSSTPGQTPMGEPVVPSPLAPPPPPERPRRGWVWALIVILALLLVGVGVGLAYMFGQDRGPTTTETPTTAPGTESPDTESPDTESPDPTETESPDPAAPISFPTCDVLNPEAQAASDEAVATHGGPGAFTPPPGEAGADAFALNFGPSARAAFDEAVQYRGCYYVFSFHDALTLFASELPEAPQATLVAALQAEPAFVESTVDGAQFFAWGDATEDFGTFWTVHAFVDDVWVAMFTTGDPELVLQPTLDALRTANPSLSTG